MLASWYNTSSITDIDKVIIYISTVQGNNVNKCYMFVFFNFSCFVVMTTQITNMLWIGKIHVELSYTIVFSQAKFNTLILYILFPSYKIPTGISYSKCIRQTIHNNRK